MIFYKTKLSCHNLTSTITSHMKLYAIWFDEVASDITASTFVTCVRFLETRIDNDRKVPIILYSYGCTCQNRNSILGDAPLQFSAEYNREIIQTYLVVGQRTCRATVCIPQLRFTAKNATFTCLTFVQGYERGKRYEKIRSLYNVTSLEHRYL